MDFFAGKQKITDQIAQLKYKEPNSPRIVVLEQELVRAEAESLVAEAQLSNITREKLKAAFTYQFDALKEHSEKLAIIAGFGKHLLELVDDTPVTPGETREAYDGYEASKAYVFNLQYEVSFFYSHLLTPDQQYYSGLRRCPHKLGHRQCRYQAISQHPRPQPLPASSQANG